MDFSFFVALNRPAVDSDVTAVVGDQFTIDVVFYEVDGDEVVADLTGGSASLQVLREDCPQFTIAGSIATGTATFDLAQVDLSDIIGRNALRVMLTRDGRSCTVIDGAFTVRE